MRKLSRLFIVLIIFSGYSFAQHTLSGSITLYPSSTQIVKINGSTYDSGTKAIGNETVSGNTYVYRTYFTFSLNSIPNNATISQVTVYYTNDINGYSFKLTKLSTISSDNGSNWSAIANGTSLHTGLPYNTSGSSFVSASIKSAIQSALSNQTLYIGALSESENTNGSATTISMSAYVTYTYPAAILTLSARNDLEGGNGGVIGAVKYPSTPTSNASPYAIPSVYETDQVNLAAYDQTINSVNWVFNDSEAPLNPSCWKKDVFNTFTDLGQSASFTTGALTKTDNGASFVAYLKRVCNTTFQNSLPENGGNVGNIYLDGTSYNVTKILGKVRNNYISVSSNNNQPVVNGIMSVFDHWSDGNTSSTRSIYVSSDGQSYTCYYKGKPSTSSRGLTISSTVGQPVQLSWNEHPSTNVTQYKIYRKVRPAGGITGSEVLLATVNRGTTSYVDRDYIVSNVFYYQVFYDVRYVYSGQCDGINYTTNSDMDFVSTFADEGLQAKMENSSDRKIITQELPSEYSLNNYPNPFNPTTTINYQLPSEGMVTLKIYDVIGKEIATLVDGHRAAGTYNIEFNASDLPSGVYIYRLSANNFTQSKKMLLVK